MAYSGARRVEYPRIKDGKVVGFFSYAPSSRAAFPVDMASFAVSIRFVHFTQAVATAENTGAHASVYSSPPLLLK